MTSFVWKGCLKIKDKRLLQLCKIKNVRRLLPVTVQNYGSTWHSRMGECGLVEPKSNIDMTCTVYQSTKIEQKVLFEEYTKDVRQFKLTKCLSSEFICNASWISPEPYIYRTTGFLLNQDIWNKSRAIWTFQIFHRSLKQPKVMKVSTQFQVFQEYGVVRI